MSAQSDALQTGLNALKQERYAAAIESLELFCQHCRNPQAQDYVHAQKGLAKAYYRIGQPEKSIAVCRKLAASQDPQVQAWARNILASMPAAKNKPSPPPAVLTAIQPPPPLADPVPSQLPSIASHEVPPPVNSNPFQLSPEVNLQPASQAPLADAAPLNPQTGPTAGSFPGEPSDQVHPEDVTPSTVNSNPFESLSEIDLQPAADVGKIPEAAIPASDSPSISSAQVAAEPTAAANLPPLTPKEAAERFETGQKALRQGCYEAAVEALEDYCHRVNPRTRGYSQAQRSLVKAYQGNGQQEAAIALCQQMTMSEKPIVKAWASQFLHTLMPADTIQPEAPVPLPASTSDELNMSASDAAVVAETAAISPQSNAEVRVKLKSLSQLQQFYKTELVRDLKPLEASRQRALKTVAIASGIFLVITGIALLFLPRVLNSAFGVFSESTTVIGPQYERPASGITYLILYLFGLLIVCLIWAIFCISSAEKYREADETHLSDKITNFVDENDSLHYFQTAGDWDSMEGARNDFSHSTIFNHLPRPGQMIQNYCVTGRFGETDIFFSELLALDEGGGHIHTGQMAMPSGRRGFRIGLMFLLLGCAWKLLAGILQIVEKTLKRQRIYIHDFRSQMLEGKPAQKILFKGLFLSAHFENSFAGTTVMFPGGTERLMVQIGSVVQWLRRGPGQQIDLRVPKFDKLFCVCSDNPTEARQIFSPKLMKKLFDFRQKTGRKIYLSFVENRVYVALQCDWFFFEPKVLRHALNFRPIQDYFEYLQFISGLIEELNRNQRLRTKQ